MLIHFAKGHRGFLWAWDLLPSFGIMFELGLGQHESVIFFVEKFSTGVGEKLQGVKVGQT